MRVRDTAWTADGGRPIRLGARSARLCLAGATLALGGCMVGPDYLRPAAIVPAQYKEMKGWKLGEPRDDFAKGQWWTVFHDPELDALMPQVAASNQTLKADEANYREAQALIAQGRAQLFPTLSLNPELSRSSSQGPLLTAEANASWTLDLWGGVRRTIEGETAGAQASAATLANATLSMQSSLATAYFELRETDALHDLLADTVAQYKRSLDITQNQYSAGTSARSDVITAKAQLLAAQAQAINTGVARAQYEHAIAVLIGRAPAQLTIPHGGLSRTVPSIPLQLPSALLERRPDIAGAERTMQQQNAQIGVAMAAYYPSVSLSGAFGYSGDPFRSSLGVTNPAWSYGLSIAQTLFNGGLTAAQVAAAKANYDASVATYRQTVLTAFQQVEDELAAIRVLSQEAGVQAQAVAAAEQAVQIALNEYRAGTQAFTTVVTAQATALSDEESLLTTREQRLAAAVSLIVALGGGWDTTQLPSPAAAAAGPGQAPPVRANAG
ncbi:efflux transporter outer membrane subunit [Labrys wisconsinensis]|uniref:NodT family efflux transporter outer membrane factor (OMF) lipoprotein n=1 Tax=Labrys wisconsinensis TaxID=425677 RepID=A0ABU0JP23_9HYPH|nr:efflux transporter outer membrane subunit [Labrys wisconsinensis]MDQ0475138.1 NodT family efflux transporter outer membrane factor (OMF) lipoprotein [Labrys wisconsinensis]